MINSKKMLALCATTVASFSTFGALSQAVFADTPKTGDTVVKYDSNPQPAEWGLSVPAALNLTKDASDAKADTSHAPEMKYNIGTVEIVAADGSEFVDQTSDRIFRVNVSSKYAGGQNNGYMRLVNKADNTKMVPLMAKVSDQGVDFTDYQATPESSITNLNNNLVFESKSDQSNARVKKDIVFAVNKEAASLINTDDAGLENTLTWTATE